MDKHYDPVICTRLQQLAQQGNFQGILSYLHTLSHTRFRTAGYVLGESIMPKLSEPDVWRFTSLLCNDNAKAFLVTMMKAIAKRISDGELTLRSTGAKAFMAQAGANAIDRQKVALQLLPVLTRPDDIRWLMRHLGIDDGKDQLTLLLRIPTEAAGYALFRTLRYAEHDRPLLIRTAQYLIQRGDGLGFNIASLIRTYYGLDEVKGTFSLRIQPYQLARIEASYDAFCDVVKF